MSIPKGLGCGVERRLKVPHQALQAFALASGLGHVVGDHAGMAEIQQQRRLLRGEAQDVLVVVVEDLHQICKQHRLFVGRNPGLWMGKAVIRREAFAF